MILFSQLFSYRSVLAERAIRNFIERFAKEDNWHEIDRKTANLGYGWMHYALIRILRPKRVLVIGSRYGYIPAICALACRDNKKGAVDFVDAGFDFRDLQHKGKDWGGVGLWRTKKGRNYFKTFGLQNHITIHVMESEEFWRKFPNLRWGYIYIDGDHSYKGVKSDFDHFWPRLTTGGFLGFHDIHIDRREGQTYGVKRVWEKLKSQGRWNLIELPGEFGLGLIQK